MSSVKVESVVEVSALVGEGPVWEEPEQTLLFVDIPGHKIHRRPISFLPYPTCLSDSSPVSPVCLTPPSCGYVAGVGRSIVAVDCLSWNHSHIRAPAVVDEDKLNTRLNDGKVDPIGRLWAGTMVAEGQQDDRKQGSLFSVTSDLTVTKHLSQVDISNGMDWSLDQKTFFYIDSLSLTVDAFDYDVTTGKIGNRRVVYRMQEGEGLPDGMTMDAGGRLWVACYNGGRVINIDNATGVRLQTIPLPATKTTSCCFGGPDYSDLYVTSASLGLDQSELKHQPQAGHTFRLIINSYGGLWVM
uniref:Regucalcin n=1 Tax=Amphiprion ocellaris TaxID=80972 RepID=A0AAQ5Y3G2_AMPOC